MLAPKSKKRESNFQVYITCNGVLAKSKCRGLRFSIQFGSQNYAVDFLTTAYWTMKVMNPHTKHIPKFKAYEASK